jgi:hypothetical protein
MTSTTVPRPPGTRPDGTTRPAMPVVAPAGGRQRRWSLALLAVLVTVGSAVAFAVLWMNAGDRKPVLAVSRDVAAGQVIEAGDLEVVRVSADPALSPVPSSERDSVIGQTASVDLVAGTLLTSSMLGDEFALDPSTAVVAVALERGEMPTSQLRVGDRVLVIFTASVTNESGDRVGTPEVLDTGEVFNIEAGAEEGVTIVSLAVNEAVADGIATAEDSDQISLALVGSS